MNRKNSNLEFRLSFFQRLGLEATQVGNFKSILELDKIDVDALKRRCMQQNMPASLRGIIWKVLLDIIPLYKEAQEFVESQLYEQYADIKHAVTFISNSSSTISSNNKNAAIIANVYLLHLELLKIENKENYDLLIQTATEFINLLEDEIDAYWCLFKFINQEDNWSKAVELSERVQYRDHEFSNTKIAKNRRLHLCLFRWFKYGFCGVFPSCLLTEVWDMIMLENVKVKTILSLEILRYFKYTDINMEDLVIEKKQGQDILSKILKFTSPRISPSHNHHHQPTIDVLDFDPFNESEE